MKSGIHTSWNFLNDWSIARVSFSAYTHIPDWDNLNPFVESARKVFELNWKEVIELLKKSDKHLKHLNGDPMNYNWKTFRPLRLSREEDWSDWLAFLIQSSCGNFNKTLLPRSGFSEENYSEPLVEREVASGGYRSDIIILWNNEHADHIEVKIGDLGLRKTFGTSVAMRKRYGKNVKAWYDWILLLDWQLYEWDDVVEQVTLQGKYKDISIKSITWLDVAVAIGRCLYNKTESITWMSWAFAFTGAIEAYLYNIQPLNQISDKGRDIQISDNILHQQTILTRSMLNEESK